MNQRIKDSTNPDVPQIADDLDEIASIAAVSDTQGGKVLIKSLIADIISDIDTLSVRHKELTLQEFVGISSDLKNKGDLVKVLVNAKKNKKYLETLLEEALAKEAE